MWRLLIREEKRENSQYKVMELRNATPYLRIGETRSVAGNIRLWGKGEVRDDVSSRVCESLRSLDITPEAKEKE